MYNYRRITYTNNTSTIYAKLVEFSLKDLHLTTSRSRTMFTLHGRWPNKINTKFVAKFYVWPHKGYAYLNRRGPKREENLFVGRRRMTKLSKCLHTNASSYPPLGLMEMLHSTSPIIYELPSTWYDFSSSTMFPPLL